MQADEDNPTLSFPPKSEASSDILDNVSTEGQERNSPNWEVGLRTLNSKIFEAHTLVKYQTSMDNNFNMSFDVENENLSLVL